MEIASELKTAPTIPQTLDIATSRSRNRHLLSCHCSIKVIARLGFGVYFLASSLTKFADPFAFFEAVYAYELLEPYGSFGVAVVLPAVEFAIGFCLISGIALEGSLLAALILLTLFVGIQLSALWRGLAISCGCFVGATVGSEASFVGHATILRTGLLWIVACALLVQQLRMESRKSHSPGDSALLAD